MMRLLILGAITALLAGCASLPPLQGRVASTALTDTESTTLGTAVADAARANPGRSGVLPLVTGTDAFAARAVLASVAQRWLDVQ